jgi:PleD family two-component response regulator
MGRDDRFIRPDSDFSPAKRNQTRVTLISIKLRMEIIHAVAYHRADSWKRETILIVEDNVMIRNLLRMALVTQGYEVHEASNLQGALELQSMNPALNFRSRPEAFI